MYNKQIRVLITDWKVSGIGVQTIITQYNLFKMMLRNCTIKSLKCPMSIWRWIGKYTYKAQRKERNEKRRAKIKKLFMLTMQEYEIPENEILIQTQYTPCNAKLHPMGFTKCGTK